MTACANISLIPPKLYKSIDDQYNDKIDALNIIHESYNDMITILNENHYYVLLKVCNNLVVDEEEKIQVVGKHMTQCCKDGYLSVSVFNMLRNMRLLSNEDKSGILQSLLNGMEYNNTPKEWSRRVKMYGK